MVGWESFGSVGMKIVGLPTNKTKIMKNAICNLLLSGTRCLSNYTVQISKREFQKTGKVSGKVTRETLQSAICNLQFEHFWDTLIG